MIRIAQRAFSSSPDLAIDLGTANTIVVERGSGIVFDEPSVCCFSGHGEGAALMAAGIEAQSFVGRVARPLRIERPLRNGVLSDMTAARELLGYATRRLRSGWRVGRPRVVIGVPADATQAERTALVTAAADAGLAGPELVAEPFLAALGAGLEVDEPRGRLIVDCGAGTTEVAVISLGAICLSHSVRGGGEALDRAFIDHLHLRRRFQIGPATAERLKLELSALVESGATDRLVEVRGLDSASGVPMSIAVPAAELLTVWERYSEAVVGAVLAALSETPPELSQDILEDGILLTGGAALMGLLAQEVEEATGIEVRIADAPLTSVANGLERIFDRG
ncbi:MAG TPA: rod shape-determining protein MreB [Allosphingosinicella sp.]|nr:rod shape-determining protein MreB [Allosphingosinicella sp.]